MINIDAKNHVRGTSIYLDDIQEINGTLYALPFYAPVAHAKIIDIESSEALSMDGVKAIYTEADIPGENQIGGIFPDEPLFSVKEIHYWGQPLGMIVGTSDHTCRMAREKIRIVYEPLPVITCPREAKLKNLLIAPPRSFRLGDMDSAWKECTTIVEGKAESNGQEHLYIETQGAYALMKEDGSMVISSSTQGPTAVQRTVAKVLGIPMHKVEVDVVRLGGGFGGKEDQATSWAVMVALATFLTGKPVKLSMHRMDDMLMTGKRHPYTSDFKIGLSSDLRILAYEVTFYQNAGAAADLSPAVLERTLFHATNAYYVPNVLATAYSCKTNLPPNTAFRGFGGPQGMFVMESAIAKAAETLGVHAYEIQQRNLIKDGDEFSYGQVAEKALAVSTWNECVKKYRLDEKINRIETFNHDHFRYKKGVAVQPICFGISFTNTMMNHARALVHIYGDGSIGISTGAVEMGQGVNTKLFQIVKGFFDIPISNIRIETTNTLRIANTSPTAASAGADLNGKALEIACHNIWFRLLPLIRELLDNGEENDYEIRKSWIYSNNKKTGIAWTELVSKALQKRISLSEHAHYATPLIHFDKKTEKGHPFAYHVFGTAIVEVTVDCLRGIYDVNTVDIVHDFGKSMNVSVDHGQVEGGVVQGIGWMTMEEILYNSEGRLLTNALSTYKIPDIYAVPERIRIHHIETLGHELAIKKSKAVGEPPLMYGLGVYFAIRNAVRAFNPDSQLSFDAPYTPEKVLIDCYRDRKKKVNVYRETNFSDQKL